jgi:hypothetical protein
MRGGGNGRPRGRAGGRAAWISTRARRLFILTLAVCALGIGAAEAAGQSGTPSGTIALVGDSNLLLGASAIDYVLLMNRDNGWVTINGSRGGSGIRKYGGQFWSDRIAALPDADMFLTNLGVNDTPVATNYANYDAKIDAWLSLLPGGKPVLWSTVPCRIIKPKNRLKGCRAVNAAIRSTPSRHPSVTVIEWAKTANSHPEWIASDGFGVHYTPIGYAAYANLVVKATG